jgi:hypothetical protein
LEENGTAAASGPTTPTVDIDDTGYIAPIDLNILFVHYGQHYP